MMMMMHSTSANLDDLHHSCRNHQHHQIVSEDQEDQSIIIKSTCPISWKLYQNPFFTPNTLTNYSINTNDPTLKLKHKQLQRKYSAKMSSNNVSDYHQLSKAKTQIAELKAELEMERKLRKKMETVSKKLSREIVDQVRKERMCVCEDLTKEIARLKEEKKKMKAEMEEERKMLRMAEVFREERVQMKLADAHLFYHQEFLNQFLLQAQQQQQLMQQHSKKLVGSSEQKFLTGGKTNVSGQRKVAALPEAENPHIKQGTKGFVEFQRAVKARNGCGTSSTTSSCISGGSFSSKVECQKAQLRVLFKHKCAVPYSHHHDHLILS